MENSNDLIGTFARLPDGQLVKIETVYADGYATVLRIEGEWAEMIAVCEVKRLLPADDAPVSDVIRPPCGVSPN